jgi:hypothetical protein
MMVLVALTTASLPIRLFNDYLGGDKAPFEIAIIRTPLTTNLCHGEGSNAV